MSPDTETDDFEGCCSAHPYSADYDYRANLLAMIVMVVILLLAGVWWALYSIPATPRVPYVAPTTTTEALAR